MHPLSAFFGFLLGALLGAIATSTTVKELREQVQKLMAGIRPEPSKEYKGRGLRRFVSAIMDMYRIEFLFALIIFWVLVLVLYIYGFPSWEHRHTSFILGSMIGAAAAPWLWLHFTTNLDTEKTGTNQFERYRFVTYALAIAVLMAILQNYVPALLPRTERIEGFGFGLTLTQAHTDRGIEIPLVAQQSRDGTSLAATVNRLAGATSWAYRVAGGQRHPDKNGQPVVLRDVHQDLEGFDKLSVIDRDKVYIAYFYHERNAQSGHPFSNSNISNLEEYVAAANIKTVHLSKEGGELFLERLLPLSECISIYVEKLRDFKLFLVDSGPFLRFLVVDVSSQWSDEKADHLSLEKKIRNTTFSHYSENLIKQVSESIEQIQPKNNSSTPQNMCINNSLSAINISDIDMSTISATPYPAYYIAHYMAAIDSVESGVLVLRDWLLSQSKALKKQPETNSPEQSWYTVRAMLTSSQLPYRFGSVSPTHQALVKFQKETTDQIGRLIGVQDAQTWRSFCRHIDQPGMHALIGRFLALTYADERNYLFELLRPEDFGIPKSSEISLKSIDVSPSTFEAEAEAILDSTNCFIGVPQFDRRFIGLYHLNLAQLRNISRMTARGDEKATLTRKIRADLAGATLLGESPDLSERDRLDLLRRPDEFESHRARLVRFQAQLDRETENE